MTWVTEFYYMPQFEFVSVNQHGARFKKLNKLKQLPVAKLNCKRTDADGMKDLILLSHTLNVPVRYDFEKHECFIKLISHELLEETI